MIPVYELFADAALKHPDVSVLINFCSLRSAFESTIETLKYPQIKHIAIIAEGIPENHTRELIVRANAVGVNIIGPATVGGIKVSHDPELTVFYLLFSISFFSIKKKKTDKKYSPLLHEIILFAGWCLQDW